MLIGNKCDLFEQRQVSQLEGKQLADANGMLFLETSAKDNINVREMFFKAGLEIMKSVRSGLITADDLGSEGVKKNKDFLSLDPENNRVKLRNLGHKQSQDCSSEKCC